MNTAKTKHKYFVSKELVRKKLEKISFQLYRTYGKVVVIEIHNFFCNLRIRDQNCQMFQKS